MGLSFIVPSEIPTQKQFWIHAYNDFGVGGKRQNLSNVIFDIHAALWMITIHSLSYHFLLKEKGKKKKYSSFIPSTGRLTYIGH